jgi:hypothetical protein
MNYSIRRINKDILFYSILFKFIIYLNIAKFAANQQLVILGLYIL